MAQRRPRFGPKPPCDASDARIVGACGLRDASYRCLVRDSADVVHVVTVYRFIDGSEEPEAVDVTSICFECDVDLNALAAMRLPSSTPITCLTCLVDYADLDPHNVRLIADALDT